MKRVVRLATLSATVLTLAAAAHLLQQTSASAQADDPQRWLYEDKLTYEQLSGSARAAVDFKFSPPREGGVGSLAGEGEAILVAGSAAALGNVLVNDPSTDTIRDVQSETTLVLGADGTLVAGYNDSGSLVLNSSGHFDGFARSTDFGATWQDRGRVGNRAFGSGGDPVLARDARTNRMYFATLYFRGSGINVFRSDDDGLTFSNPVNAMPGWQEASGGLDFIDKQWITVDNFAGSGRGNVYVVARNFPAGPGAAARAGIVFTRSINGGQSFQPSPGLILAAAGAGNVQGAWVMVGADHAVYVFWLDQSAGTGTRHLVRVRKSVDQGVTFAPAVTVTTLLGTATNGDLLFGQFRSNSFVQAVASPANPNALYVTFNDNPAGVDRADILLSQSLDGGATWSAPGRVNDDPTTRDQWQPSLAITPDGSRLFIGFYDRRLSTTNTLIDVWGAIGTVAGGTVTFAPNFRITTESFPAVPGGNSVNPLYMGDYDQAAADESSFYYTWADNRLPNPNSVAARPRQPDVRFARIPVEGPPPASALVAVAAVLGGGNGNGLVDPNECNTFSVTLQNFGAGAATGVAGTLTTTTPGVTITQATAAYPNIPPGGTATSLTPFSISTGPAFTCGVNISLSLTVTAADSTYTFPVSLASGTPGPVNRFDNVTQIPIPEFGVIESPLTVSGMSGQLAKVRVSLHLNHTWDGDLRIALVSPDGTVVYLTLNRGGSGADYGTACGPDAARTTFDDDAATLIANGVAPFVGTFRPDQSLLTFKGKSGAAVNGIWTLAVIDDFNLDGGVLRCWSLLLSPSTCTDGGGQCSTPPADDHAALRPRTASSILASAELFSRPGAVSRLMKRAHRLMMPAAGRQPHRDISQ